MVALHVGYHAKLAHHRVVGSGYDSFITEGDTAVVDPPVPAEAVTTMADGGKRRREHFPSWLRAYVDFHRDSIHKADHDDDVAYLRWVCLPKGCGGTGDRLSGIVQAFYMAMCTSRILLVDWHSPAPLENYLRPNLIEWNYVPSKFPLKDVGTGGNSAEASNLTTKRSSPSIVYPLISALDTYDDPYHRNPYSIPKKGTGKPMIEILTNVWRTERNVLATQCMRDYLSQFSDGMHAARDLYRTAFETLFEWRPVVLDRVAAIRRELGLDVGRHYVAVHLRTGRGSALRDRPWTTDDEATWPLYYECARAFQKGLLAKCGVGERESAPPPPPPPIYLAADTRDAKMRFLELDANETRPGTVRTLPDMEIYHIDKTLRNRSGSETDLREAQLGVWSDVKLLVDSTCLVVSTATS